MIVHSMQSVCHFQLIFRSVYAEISFVDTDALLYSFAAMTVVYTYSICTYHYVVVHRVRIL